MHYRLYDPLQRHHALEKLVVKKDSYGELRRYYRFRADRWYGGIATADVVGCGLLCRYCWVRDEVLYRPSEVGDFYASKDVASRLISIAKMRGFNQLRVSGGEPTIGKNHLLELLDVLQSFKGYEFILETNGILIGSNPSYATSLSKYPFLHVRVSLKGCNEQEFSLLTGAKPDGFELQLKALRNLIKANVTCNPAVMTSFSSKRSFQDLVERVGKIDPQLSKMIEVEELILYRSVVERIKRYGLEPFTSYHPQYVPKELV